MCQVRSPAVLRSSGWWFDVYQWPCQTSFRGSVREVATLHANTLRACDIIQGKRFFLHKLATKLTTRMLYHARPFEPAIKSHFWKISSTSGDKCPQNGFKNEDTAPITRTGYPHEGPSVDFTCNLRRHIMKTKYPDETSPVQTWTTTLQKCMVVSRRARI